MMDLDNDFARTDSNEAMGFGFAAGLHILLLLWNPILFKQTWKTFIVPGDSRVVMVDIPGDAAPVPPGRQPKFSTQKPEARPLVTAISAEIPTNLVVPITGVRPAVTPSPLLSRPFHSFGLPSMPSVAEPAFSNAVPVIPIPINHGPENFPPPAGTRPWVDRGSLPMRTPGTTSPSADVSGLEGQGGGRALIQFTPPLPTSEPLQTAKDPSQSSARSDMALEGPLAHRGVLHRVIPVYPAWAEEQGVTGTTRLYFTVTRDGGVSSTVQILATSGYPELDRLAEQALCQWRFSPGSGDDLAVGQAGSQWGIITFTFSLSRK